ncbi:MAG TPA: ABC transporter ATP-binding protein [Nitriliruptoraceae bacterium]|nr:ABC transporter ATP-binding protein [Nitriliruptoraceae bacterium]
MSWGQQGVTVRFGDTVALDGIDCSVDTGAILAVVGPDGAGKTTLARVQVGLVQPASGTVTSPDRPALGYQPESSGSWSDMSVAENLDFVANAHRMGADARGRIDHLLDITSLTAARDRLSRDVSGGMRQKLAVAMAMLASPRLLVLDEPTTGLDPVSRGDVWRLLARAAEDGAAIIVTTAYLDEGQRADDVLVLDHGSILVRGTAREIEASFPGVLVSTPSRDPVRPSWRRGRTWRTWIRPDNLGAAGGLGGAFVDGRAAPAEGSPTDEPRLEPDLEDVAMAAAITRREGAS